MANTFRGGVHPPDKKELSKDSSITMIDTPEEIVIPVSQHIGGPAKPCVEKGDTVKMGQVVAEASGFVSVPQHSSVSGTVKAVEPRPHFLGTEVMSIVIENNGADDTVDTWGEDTEIDQLEPKEIVDKIQEAGVVGMGGATFPTHVKLSPPEGVTLDTLILNGAECEPYLTCDYRLMLEKTEGILGGCEILMKAISCDRGIIAVEKNKPDCIETFETANSCDNIDVAGLKVKYPQGAEKQLIYALLKRKVPAGGLPMAVNALVQNVGTAYAVYNAVVRSIPLVHRVVSVTGEGVENPGNFLVPIGTSVDTLLDHCGITDVADKVICGGPKMGVAPKRKDIPVCKGTSGLLVLEDSRLPEPGPCIRCGKCVDVCPMDLVPANLSSAAEAGLEDRYEKYNALDCIECGCCSYVCPSKRPIVHQIKLAKANIQKQKAKEKKT